MVLLLSIVAAVIPAALYIIIIYWFDRYEKEPAWLLAAVFLWGAVPSVLLAIGLGLVGSLPFYLAGGAAAAETAATILVAPIVEEGVKAVALVAVFYRHRHEIDSLLDGIIYGAMVGMGFAVVENVFYFAETLNSGGLQEFGTLVFLRAFIFGLNHALFTAMTGLGLAIARFSSNRRLRFAAPVAGWLAAVFLHFVHNLVATFPGLLCFLLPLFDWGGVLLLTAIIVWTLWQEKQWMRDYLAEEVRLGTLTTSQYERALSGRQRTRHRLEALANAGPRSYLRVRHFYHLCSDLAYKKHHFELLGESRSEALTEDLRAELARLSREL